MLRRSDETLLEIETIGLGGGALPPPPPHPARINIPNNPKDHFH